MPLTIENYRSPKVHSYFTIAGLSIALIIKALILIFAFAEIAAPREAVYDDGTVGSLWFIYIGLLSIPEIAINILTAILFLIWFYRVFKNLAPLKIKRSRHSPMWAIAAWFIPIANLFVPYQAMQQVWHDSDPEIDPELNHVTSGSGSDPLIIAWWAAFILMGLASRIITRLPATLPNEHQALAMALGSLLGAAAALLAIMVVMDVSGRQEKRAEKILSVEEFAPPAPPIFHADLN